MWSNWKSRAVSVLGASVVGIYVVDANGKRLQDRAAQYCKTNNCYHNKTNKSDDKLPTRKMMIESLKNDKEYDVLVIGGGGIGAGVAMDAQTRGLKTALVEYDDFCSGTSSKSSKLLHGGVKYLQKALIEMDYDQYKSVKDGLCERSNIMKVAPHLSESFSIVVPAYKWWQVPYFYMSVKLYDLLAGKGVIKPSRYVSREEAIEMCPMIKREKLKGAFVFFDGQQDETRVILAVILTAIRNGAKCVNHTAVTGLLKDPKGKIIGVNVFDRISGEEYPIRSKVVVNATGPLTDQIRQMSDQNLKPICVARSGIHLTLPAYYSGKSAGIANSASFGKSRLVFIFPWEGKTIVGSTEVPSDPLRCPEAKEKDIQSVIEEMNQSIADEYKIRREDVTSAWCGIRGMVVDPKKGDDESLEENHVIEVLPSGLVTIAGGKLNNFRLMAEETIDKCIQAHPELKPSRDCATSGMLLEGARGWRPMLHVKIIRDYGIDEEVAKHLSKAYGGKVYNVVKMCESTGKKFPVLGKRLHPDFPYLEAEVRYAITEYACTPIDFLARRTRLSFLNSSVANEILPKIVNIMADELNWSPEEQKKYYEDALHYLKVEHADSRLLMVKESELNELEKFETERRFKLIDHSEKGYFTSYDLYEYLILNCVNVDRKLIDDVVMEAGGDYIELKKFQKIYGELKDGKQRGRRMMDFLDDVFGPATKKTAELPEEEHKKKRTSPKPHFEETSTLL